MTNKVKFSKISQMPSLPEKDAIYFLKTPTNRMKIFVTSNDETPETIEAEYGLGDYRYVNGTNTIVSTQVSTNYVCDIAVSGSYVSHYVTSDSSETGDPIFSDLRLCHISPLCISNSGDPWLYILSINHTTHRIEFAIKKSNPSVSETDPGNLDNDNTITLRLQISGPAHD